MMVNRDNSFSSLIPFMGTLLLARVHFYVHLGIFPPLPFPWNCLFFLSFYFCHLCQKQKLSKRKHLCFSPLYQIANRGLGAEFIHTKELWTEECRKQTKKNFMSWKKMCGHRQKPTGISLSLYVATKQGEHCVNIQQDISGKKPDQVRFLVPGLTSGLRQRLQG